MLEGIELLEFSICNFKGIVIGKMVCIFRIYLNDAECIQNELSEMCILLLCLNYKKKIFLFSFSGC